MMQPLAENKVQQSSDTDESLMLVSIDNVEMLVPQKDIQTFENVDVLEQKELGTNSVGWICSAGNRLPVYCFNSNFEILHSLPEKRSICVILNKVNIAFMCNSIKKLTFSEFDLLALPECLQKTDTPVDSFCFYKQSDAQKFGMLFSARSISEFIRRSFNVV